MKIYILSLLLLSTSTNLFAEDELAITDLKIGDSPEKVIKVLGSPTGYMETGQIGIYYFDQGRVQMKSGKVTSMDLISKTQLEKQKAEEAEARAARKEKGEELLQSIKEDEYFAVLPADERLAFWEQFKIDYPEVDVYILYSRAKIEAAKIKAEEREEARMASLERRVQNAENQAQQASQAAQTAQILSYTNRRTTYPVVYSYPRSYIYRRSKSRHNHYPDVKTPQTTSGLNINLGVGSSYQNSRSSTRGSVTGPQGTMRTGTYLTSPGFGQ